jgi:hypothetical protein
VGARVKRGGLSKPAGPSYEAALLDTPDASGACAAADHMPLATPPCDRRPQAVAAGLPGGALRSGGHLPGRLPPAARQALQRAAACCASAAAWRAALGGGGCVAVPGNCEQPRMGQPAGSPAVCALPSRSCAALCVALQARPYWCAPTCCTETPLGGAPTLLPSAPSAGWSCSSRSSSRLPAARTRRRRRRRLTAAGARLPAPAAAAWRSCRGWAPTARTFRLARASATALARVRRMGGGGAAAHCRL